jgi:hypothetical protein
MSENETQPAASQEQIAPTPATALNPVTKKIVERCIQEVLSEYVQQTKHFTADSMHYLRVKVTDLVKQRLGDGEIVSVDIGLDLTSIQEVPFFFKINIPKEKVEEHIVKQNPAPVETPPQ